MDLGWASCRREEDKRKNEWGKAKWMAGGEDYIGAADVAPSSSQAVAITVARAGGGHSGNGGRL